MALVVEDGTGLSTAESYISVADWKAYCDARGKDYTTPAWTDTEIEQKLRIATGYIDTIRRYKGTRLLSSQALEFPRDSLSDDGGLAVTGVPNRVKQACAELAFEAFTTNLYENLDRGGKIKSESIGPISTTYADDAPVGTQYTAAMRLLDPYDRSTTRIGAPYMADTGDPFFTVTKDDYPGIDDTALE